MQKSYSRFHIHGNIATYRLFILINVRKNHLKPVIFLYFIYINRFFKQKKNLKNIIEWRLLIFVTRLDTRTGISHF